MLKKGDKVIVKSLDWFRNNWKSDNNGISFHHKTGKGFFRFSSGMQKFCDYIVTINNMDIRGNQVYYTIVEDKGSYLWVDELFINSSNLDLVGSIISYCGRFCIFDQNKCNNLDCPFYYFKSCKGIFNEYE